MLQVRLPSAWESRALTKEGLASGQPGGQGGSAGRLEGRASGQAGWSSWPRCQHAAGGRLCASHSLVWVASVHITDEPPLSLPHGCPCRSGHWRRCIRWVGAAQDRGVTEQSEDCGGFRMKIGKLLPAVRPCRRGEGSWLAIALVMWRAHGGERGRCATGTCLHWRARGRPHGMAHAASASQ